MGLFDMFSGKKNEAPKKKGVVDEMEEWKKREDSHLAGIEKIGDSMNFSKKPIEKKSSNSDNIMSVKNQINNMYDHAAQEAKAFRTPGDEVYGKMLGHKE